MILRRQLQSALSAAPAAYRLESFCTTKPAGPGTGLSITRSIVEVHGRRVEVEDNAGGGVAFHVTLPAGEGPAA